MCLIDKQTNHLSEMKMRCSLLEPMSIDSLAVLKQNTKK